MSSTIPEYGWPCHKCGHMIFSGLHHDCPTAPNIPRQMTAETRTPLTDAAILRTVNIYIPREDGTKRMVFELVEAAVCREIELSLAAKSEECERLREDAERLKHLHDDPLRAQAYFWNYQGRKERTAAIDAARKEGA